MAKTKKDTNARVAGQRKQTKESATEQLCMNNIPMGLKMSPTNRRYRTQLKSRCKHRYQVPNFSVQNLYILLTPSFCPIDAIVLVPSARPNFVSHSLIHFHFLAVFAFSNWATEFSVVRCLLIT